MPRRSELRKSRTSKIVKSTGSGATSLMRGDETLQLIEKQLRFLDWELPYKMRYWQGGFGALKSTSLCAGVIELSMRYPKNRWVVTRKTFTDLKDSTMEVFKEICPQVIVADYNRKDQVHTFINGSTIHWMGCEDWEKFKSMGLGGFAVDEASQVDERAILILMSRLGRIPGVPADMCFGLLASNPPNADHWLHRMFVEEAKVVRKTHKINKESFDYNEYTKDEFMMMESSTYEARMFLPPGYIERLTRMYAHDPQLIDVYIGGKFGFAMGGMRVYPEFNPLVHVRQCNYDENKPVFRTWDFGYHHPAVLWSQKDRDGRINHLREDMGNRVHFPIYRDYIIQESNIYFPNNTFVDFCDDSGNNRDGRAEKTYIEWLQEKGIRPIHRKYIFQKARDLVVDRLTKYLDNTPMLVIDPSCTVLIEGFKGGFRFPEIKEFKAMPEYPLQDGYYEHLADCNLILIANLMQSNVLDITLKQPNLAYSYGSKHNNRYLGIRM